MERVPEWASRADLSRFLREKVDSGEFKCIKNKWHVRKGRRYVLLTME